MKRRLVLHLGFSKTGTTSIQSFFRQNPDALAGAGVIYPKVGAGLPVHPALQRTVLRPNAGQEANHVALALEIRRPKRGPAGPIETPLWSNAFAQIEESGAHTAIISYENFYDRAELYRFDVLEARLREFDVTGIVYLRRQEDWATSLYGQSVRGYGRSAATFAQFVANLRPRLTYSTVLDTIAGHIPLDRLIVRNFDEAASGDLLEDFIDLAGLPRDLLTSAPDQSVRNSSLPHGVVLFLSRCNRAGLPDEAFVEVSQTLNAGARREGLPSLRPGLDVATPGERAALRQAAGADAGRLEARYGLRLSPMTRAPAAYRAFDEDDFTAIAEAVAPRVSHSTRDALGQVANAPWTAP